MNFHININKEFRSFEDGQLSGFARDVSDNNQWSCEFPIVLQDTDVVYLWLTVLYKSLIYRTRQGPILAKNIPAISTETSHIPFGNFDISTSTSDVPVKLVPVCLPTITRIGSGENYCKGDIVFEDNFDWTLSNRWTNEVRIPLDINDAEFVVYNGTAIVENGVMKIRATLTGRVLTRGFIDLEER